jgi:hypothetical protein
MKKEGNITPSIPYNNSITKCEDNELSEMSDKEFKRLLLKMSNRQKKLGNQFNTWTRKQHG